MEFHLVTAVWGKRYVDLFVDVCLPNQMTAGNLLALREDSEVTYKIYTSSQDAPIILGHELFRKIQEIIPTEVIELDHLFRQESRSVSNALLLMTQCHKIAVDSANLKDAALVFLPPDQIYSEGAFSRLAELAMSGKRVVMTPAIRLSYESIVDILKDIAKKSDGEISLTPRELVRTALPHLHPITESMFVNATNFTSAPTHFYWKVDESGFVARCFHIHPLMIWPREKHPLREGNFDTDYLTQACPDYRDYHIVCDSDEIAAFEMSADAYRPGQGAELKVGEGLGDISGFIKGHGNFIHRKFLTNKIIIHAGELTPKWEEIKQVSDRFIEKIL